MHQVAPLIEVVVASISGLDLVRHSVRKRSFCDLARVTCLLGSPIAEGGAEAVHGEWQLGIAKILMSVMSDIGRRTLRPGKIRSLHSA